MASTENQLVSSLLIIFNTNKLFANSLPTNSTYKYWHLKLKNYLIEETERIIIFLFGFTFFVCFIADFIFLAVYTINTFWFCFYCLLFISLKSILILLSFSCIFFFGFCSFLLLLLVLQLFCSNYFIYHTSSCGAWCDYHYFHSQRRNWINILTKKNLINIMENKIRKKKLDKQLE